MKLPKPPCPRLPWRRRCRVWAAEMALRHGWFRVLLHLRGMALRPRNIPWHWRHIADELHDPESRA